MIESFKWDVILEGKNEKQTSLLELRVSIQVDGSLGALAETGSASAHFWTMHIKIVPVASTLPELVTIHILMNVLIVVMKYPAEPI